MPESNGQFAQILSIDFEDVDCKFADQYLLGLLLSWIGANIIPELVKGSLTRANRLVKHDVLVDNRQLRYELTIMNLAVMKSEATVRVKGHPFGKDFIVEKWYMMDLGPWNGRDLVVCEAVQEELEVDFRLEPERRLLCIENSFIPSPGFSVVL